MGDETVAAFSKQRKGRFVTGWDRNSFPKHLQEGSQLSALAKIAKTFWTFGESCSIAAHSTMYRPFT